MNLISTDSPIAKPFEEITLAKLLELEIRKMMSAVKEWLMVMSPEGDSQDELSELERKFMFGLEKITTALEGVTKVVKCMAEAFSFDLYWQKFVEEENDHFQRQRASATMPDNIGPLLRPKGLPSARIHFWLLSPPLSDPNTGHDQNPCVKLLLDAISEIGIKEEIFVTDVFPRMTHNRKDGKAGEIRVQTDWPDLLEFYMRTHIPSLLKYPGAGDIAMVVFGVEAYDVIKEMSRIQNPIWFHCKKSVQYNAEPKGRTVTLYREYIPYDHPELLPKTFLFAPHPAVFLYNDPEKIIEHSTRMDNIFGYLRFKTTGSTQKVTYFNDRFGCPPVRTPARPCFVRRKNSQ